MKFFAKQKRKPTLIILPLLDILAILLIFFIVTTTFKKNLPQLQINLPESRTAAMAPAEKLEPLLLRVLDDENITLDDQPVTLEELAGALRRAREESPDRDIAMQADREAPFGLVVGVLDSLQEAGIRNIPAFTQPIPQPSP